MNVGFAHSASTRHLIDEQLENIYTCETNMIQAAMSDLCVQQTGHVVVLTSVASQASLPGLAAYTATARALEAWCASVAYELAAHNVCTTIVQAPVEVFALTGLVTRVKSSEPRLQRCEETADFMDIWNCIPVSNSDQEQYFKGSNSHTGWQTGQLHVSVPKTLASATNLTRDSLLLETVHAIAAIGGHDSPPTRHVVGDETARELRRWMVETLVVLDDLELQQH